MSRRKPPSALSYVWPAIFILMFVSGIVFYLYASFGNIFVGWDGPKKPAWASRDCVNNGSKLLTDAELIDTVISENADFLSSPRHVMKPESAVVWIAASEDWRNGEQQDSDIRLQERARDQGLKRWAFVKVKYQDEDLSPGHVYGMYDACGYRLR